MSPELGFVVAITLAILAEVLKALKLLPRNLGNIIIVICICALGYFAYAMKPAEDKYIKASKALDKTHSSHPQARPHPWFDINTYW